MSAVSVRSAALRALDGFGERAISIAASVAAPSRRCATTSTSCRCSSSISMAAEGRTGQTQSVLRIHLAPLLPAKHRRRIDKQYSLHARFGAGFEKNADAAFQRRQRIGKPGRFPDQFGVELAHQRLDDGCEQALLAVVMMIERPAVTFALATSSSALTASKPRSENRARATASSLLLVAEVCAVLVRFMGIAMDDRLPRSIRLTGIHTFCMYLLEGTSSPSRPKRAIDPGAACHREPIGGTMATQKAQSRKYPSPSSASARGFWSPGQVPSC